MDKLMFVVGILAVVVFGYLEYKKARKIDAEGTLTDAVVSRIDKDYDSDPDSNSYTYLTYVTYLDEQGRKQESLLARSDMPEYKKGDQLKIRFLPGDYKMVRKAK